MMGKVYFLVAGACCLGLSVLVRPVDAAPTVSDDVSVLESTEAEGVDPVVDRSVDDPVVDRSVGGRVATTTSAGGDRGGVEVTRERTGSGSPGRRWVPTEEYWRRVWELRCGYTVNYHGSGDYSYSSGSTVDVIWVRPAGIEGRSDYRISCNRADGTSYDGGTFDLPDGSGVGPIDPTRLRDDVAAEIVVEGPEIDTSPSFREWFAIVRFPTWLWVTDPWVPRGRAGSDGGLDVEVTATPVEVVWEFDEPNASGRERCSGPGKPWVKGARNNGDTNCSYTFTHSSAGHGPNDAFAASATWSWELTWTLDGADQGGFGTIIGVTDFELQVGEILPVSVPNPTP